MAFKHTFRPSCHSVFGVVGNINSPVSNIALQWEKNVQNAVSLATSRASAGVEHDDKLDSSNPILSLRRETKKPLLWSAIQPHSLQQNILRICT